MTSKSEQLRAVFLAALMVVSVFGMTAAFAGSAAATVQDFDGVSAGDVVAGQSVEQTVTLENVETDGSGDTITISNDAAGLDDTVIAGPGGADGTTRVSSANGHGASVTEVQSNGTIVVETTSSASANLVVTVEMDLTSYQDDTVTYTATSQANSISQSTTFDVSVAKPSVDSAVIPESAPNTVEVTFDESIQQVGTDAEVANAFTLNGATEAPGGTAVTIDRLSTVSGDTVVLKLTDYVAAAESDVDIDYTGEADGTDPIANAADSSVFANDVAGAPATSNAVPTLQSAEVVDGSPGKLHVTFTEPVDGNDATAIASAFSLSDSRANIDGVDEDADTTDQDRVILSLDNNIAPGADLTGLSYNGDAETTDPITATSTGEDVYDFQDRTASNGEVPSIQSSEVTAADPGQVLVTYDGDIEAASGADFSDFQYAGSQDTDGLDFNAGDSTQVAVSLSTDVKAADGTLSSLTYDPSATGATGTPSVQSVSGVSAASPESTTPTNNVAPTFVSAEVRDTNPDQVRVTFSEVVVADVGTGNIDSAVTDAFEVNNSDVDYRVKNVDSGLGTKTVVLNLGLEDGTTQEVDVGDDLTGALSYDPSAPSGDEQNPLVASGTTVAAESFTNEDVTNNVDVNLDVAEVTTDGEEIRVTFTDDVNKVGTLSEIENAFSVGSSVITIDSSGSFTGIENGDTVVFNNSTGQFVDTPADYHSGTDLTAASGNGISYDAAAGNNPLEIAATGDPVSDFPEQDITNNIQPRIDSAEVTNANPGEIQVTYTEDITDSDVDAYEAFTLSGSDKPEITGQATATNTLTLTLADDVASGDDLGMLTYNGGVSDKEVISGHSTAVGVDGDSIDVTNNVGTSPVLQNVTIDDTADNNDYTIDGQMLLAFDRAVNVDAGTASGLSFEGNSTEFSVSIVDGTLTDPSNSPANVVAVDFTSDSGSDSSMIRAENDLSDASLTVTDASSVEISGADKGNQIAENKVTDVRNEIAGDLASVDSTKIDVELIGTEVDTKGGFTVTVTGFEDADGTKVIDETITVEIGDKEYPVTPNRFSESATVTELDATTIDKDTVEVGSEVTVDVKDAEVGSTENVTYVHEAYTQSEGWELTSQPMPGEFVAGENITDVTYYDADAAEDESEFGSYDTGNQVQMVHNALFVNADSDGAEYGFAYDEDRSGQQTNVGDINMGEGWHIVGSNYDIDNGGADLTLKQDLGTENDPNSAAVNVQLKSLPGSTLTNDATVGSHGVYYVYLHQEDNRPIVLPAYTGTNTASEDTQVAP